MSTSTNPIVNEVQSIPAPKPNGKDAEKKSLITVEFKFDDKAYAVLLDVFIRSFGETSVKKLSAVQVQSKFAAWMKDRALDSVKSKRNSLLTTEYNREVAERDKLNDAGMTPESADQEAFGMSGTARRRKLTLDKAARLF